MASPVPSPSVLRVLRRALRTDLHESNGQQVRHATLLRRPKRPYTFTQLVTLSDGSTFLHRTTSPAPVYKSTKDMMNTALWNPSSQKLMNAEEDEAGKLAAFRAKFGRGWDVENASESAENAKSEEKPADNLMDLISGFGQEAGAKAPKKPKEGAKGQTQKK